MTDQPEEGGFDLDSFLPYLLNQAAEAVSREFGAAYRSRYGLTRTQWRVLAHLGRFGPMTARDIRLASHEEKTRISRAVSTLEEGGLLRRKPSRQDGRAEILSLTNRGLEVVADLGRDALAYDAALRARLGAGAGEIDALLRRLIRRGQAG